jgi:hypothetical protein
MPFSIQIHIWVQPKRGIGEIKDLFSHSKFFKLLIFFRLKSPLLAAEFGSRACPGVNTILIPLMNFKPCQMMDKKMIFFDYFKNIIILDVCFLNTKIPLLHYLKSI